MTDKLTTIRVVQFMSKEAGYKEKVFDKAQVFSGHNCTIRWVQVFEDSVLISIEESLDGLERNEYDTEIVRYKY